MPDSPAPSPEWRPVRPSGRILTAVVALLVLVGVLPLVLLGSRLAGFNRDRLQLQQNVHQLVLAESIAVEVSEFVRSREALLAGLARGLETALVASSPQATLDSIRDGKHLERFFAEDPDLLRIVFAVPVSTDDGSGHRLACVDAGRDVDPRFYASAEETLVGRLLQSGLDGRAQTEVAAGEPPALVLVSPVRRSDQVAAVVAGIESLAEIRRRIEARSQQLYTVSIVDAAGKRLLAHSGADAPAQDLLGSDLVSAFRLGGGTRTMPFRSGRGAEMLGAFATMPETGWGVLVAIDAASAYHDVSLMKQTTLRWGLAAALLAVVLGALFAQWLVHPIRALTQGALRLARGDFSRPILIRSRNELGILASSFNHMAEEIQAQLGALEMAARENKELFVASIRMLAEAIDEKDPYTRGHSERVTRFAVATGRAYGLGPEEVEKIQIGALLHDVGKIGIDDQILRKPSMLTDEEFEIMKQHPDKGAHIMGTVRQLHDIVPGMRFHHEKVDGTGYPLGLKGDEIPLAAQIISVADTFDAMTTDRPYQKGMDPEFVVGKLRGWIGTRFRADVVDAFEKAFRAGAIELRVRRERAEPRLT